MTCTVYILLAVVVYFCFAKSLFSPFVFDDSEALVQNADVTSDGFSLLAIFKHDFWGNNLTDKSSHKSYRPLTILMYRCIRSLTMTTLDAEQNQLNAVYFHGANLIFYYLLCCQLYRALCSFLSSPIIQFSKQKSSDIALYTTFLFAAHPLHSEPVYRLTVFFIIYKFYNVFAYLSYRCHLVLVLPTFCPHYVALFPFDCTSTK